MQLSEILPRLVLDVDAEELDPSYFFLVAAIAKISAPSLKERNLLKKWINQRNMLGSNLKVK